MNLNLKDGLIGYNPTLLNIVFGKHRRNFLNFFLKAYSHTFEEYMASNLWDIKNPWGHI